MMECVLPAERHPATPVVKEKSRGTVHQKVHHTARGMNVISLGCFPKCWGAQPAFVDFWLPWLGAGSPPALSLLTSLGKVSPTEAAVSWLLHRCQRICSTHVFEAFDQKMLLSPPTCCPSHSKIDRNCCSQSCVFCRYTRYIDIRSCLR